MNRRDFVRLFGAGIGVAFASGLVGCGPDGPESAPVRGPTTAKKDEDFFFLQLSDTHWGFSGPPNPEADVTLPHAVAAIAALETQPAFVVFTGDLTQLTDDPALRRERMRQFKEIVKPLESEVRFLPGEHDASLDSGAAYKENFGDTHWTFDRGGIRFVALDNVSDPDGAVGDAQIAWLAQTLAPLSREAPIVVFAHRPLFDLFPAWEWATADGAKVLEVLARHDNVTVFYGHIHQEHHHLTGRIAHHATRSLIFPLPTAGSVPKKAALPWDATQNDHGLGFRRVTETARIPAIAELDAQGRRRT